MKTFKFFAAALAVVALMGLTSCTKTEKKIIGKWECTTATITNVTPVDSDILDGDDLKGTIWEFAEDKTVTITDGTEVTKGTYTIDNKDEVVMTFTQTEEDITMTMTMDLNVTDISKSDMTVEGKMSMNALIFTATADIKATFTKK